MLPPKNNDPRIWCVSVRPKEEKKLILKILTKFSAVLKNPEFDPEFNIYSASYLDKHPGFIFIEAKM